MVKRVRRSNVKDGVLLPLGNGFSLVKGDHPNKTDDVDIGPNNKNGLSVNHGEILQQKGNTLRVFSAEPMLGGVSPVQLLYGGMAPDKVFAIQEQYKQANRIADDGTKYKKGGKKQTPLKEIDWSGITTTNNRPYNAEYINYINKSLINSGYNNNQRASILANIIEESGGDPFAEGPGGYYGLLQWGDKRYSKGKETDVYKEIDNQLKYLNDTIGNTNDKKSWTHGGKGSGYNSFTDAMAAYNSDDLNKVMHGFTWGYVRPAGKQNSYLNRQKVADQLINLEGFKYGGIYIKPSKRGTFTAAAKQHGMSVQGFASKVLANKENYSPAMVKKANFARNASKWNHLYGGENILINPLGERPNAKFGKEMKNKRNKAERGIIQPISGNISNFPFTDKYGNIIGVNGNISRLSTPSNIGINNPPIRTLPNTTQNSGLSATAADAIGAGINALGSLIGAKIQQDAIDKLDHTIRQYALLDSAKLKTKINIAPQLGQMREHVAKISDAARRTSASSRNTYQKIADARLRGLDYASRLYGQKENTETELINQDRLNQQQVAHANATNVINAINQTNESRVNNENYKRIATSNNWNTYLNTNSGNIMNLIDRNNARSVKAGELYVQAMANPDAARLLYGDIDFTTDANKRRAFRTIYDFLNNNRLG